MKCPNGYLEQLMKPLRVCTWKLASKLDEGEDGYVVQACCEGECKYIVKVIDNKMHRSNFLQKVSKEISIQSSFAELGLAPLILDAWMCNNEASIVMEKKDMNLVRYVQTLLNSRTYSSPKVLQIIDDLEHNMIDLVKAAHKHRLVHGDLHLKNVMVDVSSDFDLEEWSNMKLVDFGKSYRVDSETLANSEEPITEIKLSFNMLRKSIFANTSVPSQMAAKSPPKAPTKKKGKVVRSPSKSPRLSRSPLSSRSSLFGSPQKTPIKSKDELFLGRPKSSLFDDDFESTSPVKRSLF